MFHRPLRTAILYDLYSNLYQNKVVRVKFALLRGFYHITIIYFQNLTIFGNNDEKTGPYKYRNVPKHQRAKTPESTDKPIGIEAK